MSIGPGRPEISHLRSPDFGSAKEMKPIFVLPRPFFEPTEQAGSAHSAQSSTGGNHEIYDSVFYSGAELANRRSKPAQLTSKVCRFRKTTERQIITTRRLWCGEFGTPANHSNAPTMASSLAARSVKKPGISCSDVGALEVRPGQCKTLARLRRLSRFHQRVDLQESSEKLVPVGRYRDDGQPARKSHFPKRCLQRG
jgi:hypothetical protein